MSSEGDSWDIWPVTAREDQPQLGTCDFSKVPHERHKFCNEFEAQGEAPQVCNSRFVDSHFDGSEHICQRQKGHDGACEDAEMLWKTDQAGAHPSQDARAEQSDEGRYSPDPPTFEMQARWLLWWRKYCDNDQSEAPTTCTADLAQTFAEWLVKRESPNFMPYPLERQLRNRISELEARTERVNRGPLCDNCGKSSKLHYCWRGDDYKGEVSTYHPSELRGSAPSPDPPTKK